ncbi:MAG TPA: ABC transporter ATP-binding protein [Chlamydiales bacterium]|nr:ABC transporter ATP-binding protein [Chlamydiales bacterium]
MSTAIEVRGVKKLFYFPHEKNYTLKQAVLNFRQSARNHFIALSDIHLDVYEGEFLGIVGRNGSGKSTLLKILAGIYSPTEGTLLVKGTLTPFIDLGIGFNAELSGRDNLYLNGCILGLSKRTIQNLYDEIVDFAELRPFMHIKLKNYSSGMRIRLAFSIAIRACSNIILIDEVLAVGDENFKKKCFDYFRQAKKMNQTVVLVSHDMNSIIEFCDRAVLIDHGKLTFEGTPQDVAKEYSKLNA